MHARRTRVVRVLFGPAGAHVVRAATRTYTTRSYHTRFGFWDAALLNCCSARLVRLRRDSRTKRTSRKGRGKKRQTRRFRGFVVNFKIKGRTRRVVNRSVSVSLFWFTAKGAKTRCNRRSRSDLCYRPQKSANVAFETNAGFSSMTCI